MEEVTHPIVRGRWKLPAGGHDSLQVDDHGSWPVHGLMPRTAAGEAAGRSVDLALIEELGGGG